MMVRKAAQQLRCAYRIVLKRIFIPVSTRGSATYSPNGPLTHLTSNKKSIAHDSGSGNPAHLPFEISCDRSKMDQKKITSALFIDALRH